ncbi:MAG TPA: LLM class F420-dependent oxidoreductase [Propionibacteriaceae bacterium]|nr:LLM class F420-dependent oxidoreductase [Propionibacteriaceae bacterium]
MDLGRIGIWTYHLNFQPASKVREVVAELEELGYGALWVGEAAYREPLTNAGLLLSATSRMVIATGIANIWARDAFTMTAGQLTLSEAYPQRFLLGLGVSHARLVEGIRGHQYERPLAAMRRYLDVMDEAVSVYGAAKPAAPPPRVLAALGPRMLALAAERAQGAHPYLVTPEHTAKARSTLGPGRWLMPEQAVVLDSDPDQARAIARRHVTRYLDLPNYTNNWRRLGFTDDDLMGQGSNRLVDALVAWGDVEAISKRLKDHLDAGADHVCVQVFDAEPHGLPLMQWRTLAKAML